MKKAELERDISKFSCHYTLLLISLHISSIDILRFVIAISREVYDQHEIQIHSFLPVIQVSEDRFQNSSSWYSLIKGCYFPRNSAFGRCQFFSMHNTEFAFWNFLRNTLVLENQEAGTTKHVLLAKNCSFVKLQYCLIL